MLCTRPEELLHIVVPREAAKIDASVVMACCRRGSIIVFILTGPAVATAIPSFPLCRPMVPAAMVRQLPRNAGIRVAAAAAADPIVELARRLRIKGTCRNMFKQKKVKRKEKGKEDRVVVRNISQQQVPILIFACCRTSGCVKKEKTKMKELDLTGGGQTKSIPVVNIASS